MKLHTKILLGLLIGAVLGITANQTLGGEHAFVAGVNHWVAGPIGQIFLRMLFMIVIPLVFASIRLGVRGTETCDGSVEWVRRRSHTFSGPPGYGA